MAQRPRALDPQQRMEGEGRAGRAGRAGEVKTRRRQGRRAALGRSSPLSQRTQRRPFSSSNSSALNSRLFSLSRYTMPAPTALRPAPPADSTASIPNIDMDAAQAMDATPTGPATDVYTLPSLAASSQTLAAPGAVRPTDTALAAADGDDGDAALRPLFPPAAQTATAFRPEQRKVLIPPHRMSPLRRAWKDMYPPLVEHLKLQVRVNPRAVRCLVPPFPLCVPLRVRCEQGKEQGEQMARGSMLDGPPWKHSTSLYRTPLTPRPESRRAAHEQAHDRHRRAAEGRRLCARLPARLRPQRRHCAAAPRRLVHRCVPLYCPPCCGQSSP